MGNVRPPAQRGDKRLSGETENVQCLSGNSVEAARDDGTQICFWTLTWCAATPTGQSRWRRRANTCCA